VKKAQLTAFILLLCSGLCVAATEVTTFHAYIDSDVCARLMLGPITNSRIECSQKTFKEGSNAVLVRLNDNTVFDVNKPKMVKEHVGKLASVTGETKEKSVTIKLQSVTPEEASAIPVEDPGRKLLDVRNFKASTSGPLYEKVRHELAMIAYITDFDFISFTMVDKTVILTGWTVRETNRGDAYHRVKGVEGVGQVINNIDVLPLGQTDMQIRADARAKLQRMLSTYFWSNGSDIKIVVKNGNIILLGTVRTKEDSDAATIQCNSVSLAFHVFNLLRVEPPAEKKKG
jgi:osmotically-inducible protein OsmY